MKNKMLLPPLPLVPVNPICPQQIAVQLAKARQRRMKNAQARKAAVRINIKENEVT